MATEGLAAGYLAPLVVEGLGACCRSLATLADVGSVAGSVAGYQVASVPTIFPVLVRLTLVSHVHPHQTMAR